MNNIVDLAQARQERTPHVSGPARCLACKHEWVAVAPTGVTWMECPSCSLIRGRFVFPHQRDGLVWKCFCENDLFHVTPDGVYCPNCGQWQYGHDAPVPTGAA